MRTFTFTAAVLLLASPAAAQDGFSYFEPGDIVSGSGQGLAEYEVFSPGMRFPIEEGPAYANSQVYNPGGYLGPAGGQCDAFNFSYPWRDNYCESRSWDMPLCPSGEGHQGQDIRAASCDKDVHWAVASIDGTITHIGSYSVHVTATDGTRHDFLHMSNVQVSVGQEVQKGDRLGYVSNQFGGTPTTVHLHFNIRQFVDGLGAVYVSPYMSLVESYSALVGGGVDVCEELPPEGGIIEETNRCFRTFGPGQFWRDVSDDGHDGALLWTNAFENDEPSNWARWRVEPGEDGRYELEVYVDSDWGVHQGTRYAVQHASGTEELTIDQSAADGWVSLGEYDLLVGEDHHVSVFDNVPGPVADAQRIAVDALRVTRVDVDPGAGGGDSTVSSGAGGSGGEASTPGTPFAFPAASEADGGCTLSTTPGPRDHRPWLLGLGALALVLRRRRR